MSNLILFLGAISASWMVWAGGILRMIPFFEDMVEPQLRKKYPRIDAWFLAYGNPLKKNLKLIAMVCLFIGCYRAWVFEHKNAQAAMYGKDGKSEAWAKYNECDKERAVNDSLAKSCGASLSYQQSRNDGQQDLFNRCMVALTQSVIPEKAKIVTRGFIFKSINNAAYPSDRTAALVATTTRDYMSFKGYLSCATPFDAYEIALSQGPANVSIGTKSGLQTKLPLNFANSNWRVGDFVFVLLHGNGLNPQECSITSQ
jgi:hypothetical protein